MAATTYFNRFPSYCKMVSHAKNLAKRSILIDHCGLEHIDLTSDFKNIERVYAIEKETKRGFSKLSLIEFKTREDADRVMRSAHHIEGLLPVPLKILRYNGRLPRNPSKQNLPFPVEHVRLSCDRELSPMFKSYTDLISNNVMSLVALKLRFVTLVNFEKILCSGMFDEYELMPFGSSVIDMGCDSGDLDLIITRKIDHHQAILNASFNSPRTSGSSHDQAFTSLPVKYSSQSPQLVHLDKSIYSETKDNSGFRGTMRWFDHVLREYMPLTDGFGVLSLHRAKVPIIKFTSRITNIDCDLSFDLGLDHREIETLCPVHSGIMMTEILYSLCRKNNLITALVIYLRIFARLNSITSKVPGIGMTNFQFLSLIIFFLQQTSIRRVNISSSSHHNTDEHQQPGLNSQYRYIVSLLHDQTQSSKTRSYSGSNSNRQEDKLKPLVPPFKFMVNGEFMRDESTMEVQNYDDKELNGVLPQLITKFFDFYSTFDFNNWSLNLYESRRDRKLDNSSIYVLNPIETNRNICHNVNRKSLDHLIRQVHLASSSARASKSDDSSDQAQMFGCPLSIIKGQLLKYQKQSKRTRTIGFSNQDEFAHHNDPQHTNHYVTPDEIAQDVCR